MIYIIIVIIYLLSLVVVGYFASKGVESDDDWAVAGRSLGIWSSAASFFTTILSALAFTGYIGYYYKFGWAGWWNWIGTIISTILFAAYFASRLRKFGGVTLSDFLEIRYGTIHAGLASLLIFFSTILFTVAQLVASGNIIKTITGLSNYISVIVVGLVFLLFTIKGGMKAVAWTSTLTSVLILVGVYILMFAILKKTGGIWNIHKILSETEPTALDPFAGGQISVGLAISWCLTWGIGNFGLPQVITKFNSCKDERVAKYSMGVSGIAFIAFYLPLMIIGLGMKIISPGVTNTDSIAAIAILKMVHPIIGGIVLSAILGAAISTGDAVLLQAGTTATRDIYQKYINKNADSKSLLKISKLSTMAVGIIAIVLSLFNSTTVLMIQANMVGILGSLLAMTVILGFSWKRSNAQGGLAGMIVGILTAVIWYILKQPYGWMPILPAIFTSTFANILVSYLTTPPDKKMISIFFND